ncbi:hypothetical protein [Streptomyces sp. NPDC055709]
MVITVEWLRQKKAGDAFSLDAGSFDPTSPAACLFTQAYLAPSWSVRVTGVNTEALVIWGTASVKQKERVVEIHFLCDETHQSITGMLVYVDLAGDWSPAEFPGLNLDLLRYFQLTNPGVLYAAEQDGFDPLIEGTACHGTVQSMAVPDRFCVGTSVGEFVQVYSRLGEEMPRSSLDDFIRALPFPGLPSVDMPEQIANALDGIDIVPQFVEMTVSEKGRRIAGARVSIRVGTMMRNLEVIPGFFTATSLDLFLELSGGRFSVAAEFSGRIGQVEAEVSAWYGSGGSVRIMGAVENVNLDPSVTQWLTEALGEEVASITRGARVEKMAVEANIDLAGGVLISAGVGIGLGDMGGGLHGYMAVEASKVRGGGASGHTVSALLELAFLDSSRMARALELKGTVSSHGGVKSFNFEWSGSRDPQGSKHFLGSILGVDGDDTLRELFSTIPLVDLKAVYTPSTKAFMVEASGGNVKVVSLSL